MPNISENTSSSNKRVRFIAGFLQWLVNRRYCTSFQRVKFEAYSSASTIGWAFGQGVAAEAISEEVAACSFEARQIDA